MKFNSRLLAAIALIGLVAVVAILADDSVAPAPNGLSPRQKFQLPKLFDFSRFKGIFKKSYKSVMEELVRQKLFLARAFRAFVSAIKYKHGQKSYYLKVNHMSDWTPEEAQHILMNQNKGAPKTTPPLPLADEEEIAAELERAQQHANEPGYKEIAEELKNSSGKSRRRRRRSAASRRDISMDDLMGQADDGQESADVEAKMLVKPPSNNPDYNAPEYISYGSEVEEAGDPSLSDEQIAQISRANEQRKRGDNNFKQVNLNDGPLKDDGGGFSFGGFVNMFTGGYGAPQKNVAPDVMHVDHRDSGCFFKPRDQGNCGSCYSFAWVAVLEYLNCKDTGKLTPFSEQYFVDCGYRYHKANAGCDGAPVYYVGKFIEQYGIELRVNYPYTKQQDRCPYSDKTPPKKMGYMKTDNKVAWWGNSTQELERVIRHTPVVINIGTEGSDFPEYGGGVHDMSGCPAENLDHAVVLVGHGREDGKDFWLIRNSYGVPFGEAGYYKLDKSVNCIFGEVFAFSDRRSKVGLELKENSLTDRTIVQNNYMDKMMMG